MGLFSFDTSKGETPESLKAKRDIAQALMASRAPAHNVGEGLGQLGNAIAYRLMQNKIDSGQAYGREHAASAFAPILSALSGGGSSPAPVAAPPAMPAPQKQSFGGYSGVPETQSVAASQLPQSGPPTDIAAGITATAKSLGIDPVDLGTAISYETAGTFDPAKTGPTTQWGQHRGLIQFGEPQAKQYGVDWKNPIGSQLGENGAVAKYLTDAGVKPGMGLMDIYSAINAGRVGRNGASDANNGGAPGTVADKVNNQMAAHRAKAMALLGGNGGQPQAPVQVANNDAQQAFQAAAQAPQQAAMPGQPQITPAGDKPRLDAATLIQAMSDPWVQNDPAKMGIIQMLLQQEMQKQDPMYQMKLEAGKQDLTKGALDLKYAQDPSARPLSPLEKIQLETGQVTLEQLRHPAPKPAEPYTLGPGEIRFDGKGNKIATGGEKPPAIPSGVQEYEYAVKQGFKGTYQDWEASKKGNGVSMVMPDGTQVQVGGNIKPMTEAQSKDVVFATKAKGALEVLDKNANALTDFGGAMLGQIPGVGNYLKSDAYQRAEQAGNEFLTAILRKESGAAIGKDEKANYGDLFLPRPGDSKGTLEQKAVSRKRAVEAIQAGMTPQAILAQEQALRRDDASKPAAPQSIGVAPPQGNNAPPQANITNDAAGKAAYDALPSGTKFVAPDGSWRVKP